MLATHIDRIILFTRQPKAITLCVIMQCMTTSILHISKDTQIRESHGTHALFSVRSLQMSPVDDTFLSAGDDGTVRMWDLRTQGCRVSVPSCHRISHH